MKTHKILKEMLKELKTLNVGIRCVTKNTANALVQAKVTQAFLHDATQNMNAYLQDKFKEFDANQSKGVAPYDEDEEDDDAATAVAKSDSSNADNTTEPDTTPEESPSNENSMTLQNPFQEQDAFEKAVLILIYENITSVSNSLKEALYTRVCRGMDKWNISPDDVNPDDSELQDKIYTSIEEEFNDIEWDKWFVQVIKNLKRSLVKETSRFIIESRLKLSVNEIPNQEDNG